jgi:hypothetical protein
MPKVSRESAQVEDHGAVEDRHGELDGYTINFVTFREEIDGTPMMKGLPDDRCQCPHWGYVVKGKLTFRFADRDEVLGPAMPSTCPPVTFRWPKPVASTSSSVPQRR